MHYTHAVVSPEGWARTWHLSEAAARKAVTADLTGYKVVEVEAHPGAKATVTKRLMAEDAPKITATPSPALVAAMEQEKAEKGPRTLAVTEGSQKCRVCREAKPVTAFPTKAANKAGEVLRDDRCRACRAEEREAKKAAAAKAAKKAPAKKKA